MVPPLFFYMKKILFFFLLLLISIVVNAQSAVKFSLRPDGTFLSENSSSIIIEFEGKTAQELYSMVKSNVITLYKSPKTVLSENEPINLSIRAISESLYNTYKLPGGFVSYKAHYNLVFHFKDGRIKVDAPVIDKFLDIEATGVALSKSFVSLVDDWFDKKGIAKSKNKKDIEKVESIFNNSINYLLGIYKESQTASEEDW